VGLKLNGICQLLAYADVVNLLGDDINTIKKIKVTLIDASLEVNIERTKYMLLCLHKNAGHNHDTMIANKSFENVA
jgi:hypothetical protein